MNVNYFWDDVISQNRDALSSYFCKDAIIRWRCTNEQFTVIEFIRVNCDYPGKWIGEIEQIEETDSSVILVGHVFSSDKKISFHVVSFIKLKNDLIYEMDEYWSDDCEAPSWRRELKIGEPIQ